MGVGRWVGVNGLILGWAAAMGCGAAGAARSSDSYPVEVVTFVDSPSKYKRRAPKRTSSGHFRPGVAEAVVSKQLKCDHLRCGAVQHS